MSEVTMCGLCNEMYEGPTVQCNCSKEPLLVIEVKDLNSTPVVRYNGQVVEGKVSIDYSYHTSGIGHPMQQSYDIVTIDKTNNHPTIKQISEKLR